MRARKTLCTKRGRNSERKWKRIKKNNKNNKNNKKKEEINSHKELKNPKWDIKLGRKLQRKVLTWTTTAHNLELYLNTLVMAFCIATSNQNSPFAWNQTRIGGGESKFFKKKGGAKKFSKRNTRTAKESEFSVSKEWTVLKNNKKF